MKKTIIKGIGFTVVFVVSLFLISGIMNQRNNDLTMEMKEATFPVIYMQNGGEDINCLHGYSDVMKGNYFRETLTPLEEGRSLSLKVLKYGAKINSISYEVRSVDDKRLVENTTLYDYVESQDTITSTFSIKDLIEEEIEYNLVILLELEGGKILRFYTRIIQANEYHAEEKLAFVRDFHERTFDKEAAKGITKYLESNYEGDNTTYNKVNIHSSFNQITWGDLEIASKDFEVLNIKELDAQMGNIKINYRIGIKQGRETNYYLVEEFYRVRYTSERMYLLDFERTMNQLFDESANVFVKNKIMLGITDQNIELFESDGGNVCVFINENKLYSYNVTDNKFAVIYGFYDQDSMDERTVYNAHRMKVLNVDETGNVQFMVYGYMNRGRHEGRVGVQVCRYSSVTNTVEEIAFLTYRKSFEVLEADIKQLAYVNRTNHLFVMLDNTVCKIDLEGYSYEEVVSNLREESFQVSDSNLMMAWQEGNNPYDCQKLILMNLNTKKQIPIEVGEGNCLAPLGFIGEDLIYGIARKDDIVEDQSGRILFPMYSIKIYNENMGILKTHQQNDVYVTGCKVEGNQIILSRVIKSEQENQYISTTDDHLMNNEVEEVGENKVEVVATEKYQKIVQIAVKSEINSKNMKVLTPKEVLFEGGREITLENEEVLRKRYYVYGRNGIEKVFTDPGNAVNMAAEKGGAVLADDGRYVWRKSSRSTKNQIMKIRGVAITEEKNSLAICLDTILNCQGISRNTEYFLEREDTAISILEDHLEGADVLDLSGCSLDSVLYYVNLDIPVLALLSDGNAVLIVGFNELNTVIMDPLTGTVFKKGMNDSMKWFEENGNCFITYLPPSV